ncbi:hypothetical protein CERSUDRAFT_127600 [Gelatoporia subvermispora B]|uniref:Uncharacterized protein n=1 Tax=Ceriporiopsis subvermispora (strain B) TaxID=914234 RepID=M2QX80_CERS8|nr:hypothetical protein CERSUDRAFT_127600 [Gelatoporia subvermispora B]
MTSIAIQRIASVTRNPTTLFRTSSIYAGVPAAPSLGRSPGYLQRHLLRWSSTSVSQLPPAAVDPDAPHDEGIEVTTIVEHDVITTPTPSSSTKLVVRVQDDGKTWLRWGSINEVQTGAAEEVVTIAEAESALKLFISILDTEAFESARWGDIPRLLELIDQRPDAQSLQKMVAHQALYPLAVFLARTHPRHALHAICVAQYQAKSDGHASPPWGKIATLFNSYSYWDLVPELVQLRLKFDGRATTDLLNQLLESFSKGGMDEDVEAACQLFEHAGAIPDDETRSLLETLRSVSHSSVTTKAEYPDRRLAPESAKTWRTIIGDQPPVPVLRAHAFELSDRVARLPGQNAYVEYLSQPKKVAKLMYKLIHAGFHAHAIHVANFAYLVAPGTHRTILRSLIKPFCDARPPNLTDLLMLVLKLEKSILGKPSAALVNGILYNYESLAQHMSPEDIVNSTQRVLLVGAVASHYTIESLNELKSHTLSGEASPSDPSAQRELQQRWDRLIALARALQAARTYESYFASPTPAQSDDVSSVSESNDDASSDDADPMAVKLLEDIIARHIEKASAVEGPGDVAESFATTQSGDGQPDELECSAVGASSDISPTTPNTTGAVAS